MPLVEMTSISKLINQQGILNNANLSIKKQEICAMIGPNGAGKTTLIKTLLGLISPDTKAGKLYLGMKQHLLLALAISHNPELLILNEYFNSVDIDNFLLYFFNI